MVRKSALQQSLCRGKPPRLPNMLPQFFGRFQWFQVISSHPGVIFPCFLPTLPEGEDFDQQGTFGRQLHELLQRNQEMIKIMEAENRQKKIQDAEVDWYRVITWFCHFFGAGARARARFCLHTSWFFGLCRFLRTMLDMIPLKTPRS